MAETPIINNQVMAEINKLSSYPIKYLTYSEMQQLRDLDLCLNCNQQYTPDHRCQQLRILLILPDEEQAPQTTEPKLEEPHYSQQDVTINALPTFSDSKALGFQAAVLNDPMATLVDTSTTHHYLHPKSAHLLGLQIDKSSTFFVLVGKGVKMMGKRLCHNDYMHYCMGLNECKMKTGESKVFIFDPGGVLTGKFLFDLEGKVDLEGVGNDTHATTHLCKVAAPLLMQDLKGTLYYLEDWQNKSNRKYNAGTWVVAPVFF